MIYECAYCNKLYDGEDGIMCVEHINSFIGTKPIYFFKCKNCISQTLRKKFEAFKNKTK